MKWNARLKLSRSLLTVLACSLVLAPGVASAQSAAEATALAATQQTADAQSPPSESAEAPPRYFDAVTVSATLNPASLKETPGTVTVIDSETIQRQMMINVADLIKFEPGIYVETVVNRIGLNGFNIRGIGGNRVMTQVDGVETSEQFDFGPFNVHQFALDLDTLKTVEIVRSSGSSLYGSDALGGVVSFFTKDPRDYIPAQRQFHFGAKTLYDSRASDTSGNAVIAGGGRRVQASLFTGYASGNEPANRGSIESETSSRTALNPQDRQSIQTLGKVVVSFTNNSILRAVVETADNDIETEAFSLRTATVRDIDSDDTMRRRRVSLDHSLMNLAGLNQLSWNVFAQNSDTNQIVDELQTTTVTFQRHGTLDYSQKTFGGAIQARKAATPAQHAMLFTFGASYKQQMFDMLRDRLDVNTATGAVIPATNLILPSKYFPKSEVGESGAYVQAEMKLGRLTLVPGVRYDRFSLDADEGDQIYIATLSPAAADFTADATSARLGAAVNVTNAITLHAQYAGGFRAPPYNAVNSGFTNLLGGYTSVPNTDLDAETSDNLEFGVRSAAGPVSFGVTGFWNAYDNFILQVQRGTNPVTRLLEFQYQNVSEVEIRGVEYQGEVRFGSQWRMRGSYAVIRGDDVSGATDVPLSTIAPDQGVVGLLYTAASNRWGSDLTIRGAHGQSQERAGTGLYAPDAYGVVDLTGWASLGHSVTLRAGVLNLTNQKYFEWPNVRGRQATDPAIDRYSSPGASGLVSVSYGW